MLLPLEGVHQLLHVHVFNTCAFIHPANVYGAPVVCAAGETESDQVIHDEPNRGSGTRAG